MRILGIGLLAVPVTLLALAATPDAPPHAVPPRLASKDLATASAIGATARDPLALAHADFDRDGVPDLIVSYGIDRPDSGRLVLRRGNVDALYPHTLEARERQALAAGPAEPFADEEPALTTTMAPELLVAGDFDADSLADVAWAARGDHRVLVASGDGRGGFGQPRALPLGGPLVDLIAAEVNRPDGLPELVALVAGPYPAALVFESPAGAAAATPERHTLGAEPRGVAVLPFGRHGYPGLAIALADRVLLVDGRDRRLSVGVAEAAAVPAARRRHLLPDQEPMALVAGSFAADGQRELAVLGLDGSVAIYDRAALDRPFRQGAVAANAAAGDAPTRRLHTSISPTAATHRLLAAPMLGRDGDQLIALDAFGALVVSADRATDGVDMATHEIALEGESYPVAAVAMRLSPLASRSLVVLRRGGTSDLVTHAIEASATFDVNSGNDVDDGTCDGTHCSLREAINAANATPDLDTIEFDTMVASTISPTSALPTITQPVLVDGSTHPNGRVVITGVLAGGGVTGLQLVGSSGGSTLRNLVVNQFSANGVSLATAGNVVEGCYIGTGANGTGDSGNAGAGISVTAATNMIGGTAASARNVISGNDGGGINVTGSGTVTIHNNHVGTDAAGSTAIANGNHGILLAGAAASTLGGAGSGEPNLIAGSTSRLVYIQSGGHTVRGNTIGLSSSGATLGGNRGIELAGTVAGVTLGGTAAGAGNTSSGNLYGLFAAGSGISGNLIQGNRFGTDPSGTLARPNSTGIQLQSFASGNTIGGSALGAGNLISGNSSIGVFLGVASTTVRGNRVGTNISGSSALPNGSHGISLSTNLNTIGGSLPGEANQIAFNSGDGLAVTGGGSIRNRIDGNAIHDNGGLGIDLNDDGRTANDFGDPDAGPNQLQNFPTITLADIVGGDLEITYSVDSAIANATYPLTVQFFEADSGASGEGKVYLGTDTYLAGDFPGTKMAVLPGAAGLGVVLYDVVVAVAIDADGNTSEFSDPRGVSPGATTFTVNSTNDVDDGTCDGTHCSLREALRKANDNVPYVDTVAFSIAGAGPHSIVPTSPLPAITDAVIVDGSTEPDWALGAPVVELVGTSAGSTSGLTIDAGGSTIRGLVINRFAQHGILLQTNGGNTIAGNVIGLGTDGATDLGNNSHGVRILSPSNTIGGLVPADRNVISGNNNYGVSIESGAGNQVLGNYIGTDLTGALDRGNSGIGIYCNAATPILGTAAGGNLISGNDNNGIYLESSCTGATIRGNRIGTDAGGTSALANNSYGMQVRASGALIGGSGPGEGNLLSGNASVGLYLDSAANGAIVRGNLVGTQADGTSPRPNAGHGIYVGTTGTTSTAIGGVGPGEGNTIAHNSGAGVAAQFGGVGTTILGNSSFSNSGLGIDLDNDNRTLNDAGDADTGTNRRQNFPVIAQAFLTGGGDLEITYLVDATPVTNADYPLRIDFFEADSLAGGEGRRWFATDSYSATDFAGGNKTVNLGPAAGLGILFLDPIVATATDKNGAATGNTSELSDVAVASPGAATLTVNSTDDANDGVCDGAHCSLREALNASNGNLGFLDTIAFSIAGAGPHSIVPTSPLPTITDPVIVDGSTEPDWALGAPVVELVGTSAGSTSGLTIDAGGSTIRGLVINRFSQYGLLLQTNGGNTIAGNVIGLGTDGATDLGNSSNGIRVLTPSNVIGGATAADRNVISGNNANGIAIESGASNVIRGNYIGTDSTGSLDRGNSHSGIYCNAATPTIGGAGAGEGNLVSGNDNYGVYLETGCATPVVHGNRVGSNAAGTGAIGNNLPGLSVRAANAVIGGAASGEGNLISGNNNLGIEMWNAANGSTVQGNLIGTQIDGVSPLANTSYGIYLRTTGTTAVQLGGVGVGQGNVIAFNNGDGIALVNDGVGTTILGNSIFSNSGLGIDLDDNNRTLNDAGDADTGTNRRQNFPVIAQAFITGGGDLEITYLVDSTPVTNADYPLRIDFFEGDSLAGGEGRRWFATDSYSATDFAGGNKTINLGPAAALGIAFLDPVVATATDKSGAATGNTSEFSDGVIASTGPVTLTVNSTDDANDGLCDGTHCSLREAINAANTNLGYVDTIAFSIAGAGPHSITPTSALPTIIDPVIVDGTTEPDWALGAPVVELVGTSAGSTNGLTVNAGGSTIRGLVINRFAQSGILLQTNGGNTVAGNILGLGTDGATDLGNSAHGVRILTPNNTIGGVMPADRNVISGNNSYGVSIESGTSNQVLGNYVGTDVTGALDRGNSAYGVYCNAATPTLGTAAGGNLISGNDNRGAYLDTSCSGAMIQGNRIGTEVTGSSAVANNYGIHVRASGVTIGGAGAGEGNQVSGNSNAGIYLDTTASGTTLRGNLIGTQADGSSPRPNTGHGIEVRTTGTTGVAIGGVGPGEGNTIAHNSGDGVAPQSGGIGTTILGNSIFSNSGLGIDLDNNNRTANDPGDADTGTNRRQNFPVIAQAFLTGGGDLEITYLVDSTPVSSADYPLRIDFFEADSPAGGEGRRWFATDSYSATDFAGGNKTVNLGPAAALGIVFLDPIVATATDKNGAATGNTSEFSDGVIASTGPATLTVNTTDDTNDGVCDGTHCSLREAINAANANAPYVDTIAFVIAGAGPHTIIPSSGLPGINDATVIDGTTEPDYAPGSPVIELDGTTAGGTGLSLNAGGSTVRGLVINRFSGAGINSSGDDNLIAGNRIGTDPTGTVDLGNGTHGIQVFGSTTTIGGSGADDGNLISGNGNAGISAAWDRDNVILGNRIGTNAAGTAALSNHRGIELFNGGGGAGTTTIGGDGAGEGNLIAGNSQHGIFNGHGCHSGVIVIEGNRIGTQADGISPLPNGTDGVYTVTPTRVGGTTAAQGNVIAHNLRVGVVAATWCGVGGISVTHNSIFGNSSLGIDLGDDGRTFNDAGDADASGGNPLQNFPVLTMLAVDGSDHLQVTYTVDSNPANATYPLTVELFLADSQASGEGRELLFVDTWTATDFANGTKTVDAGLASSLGLSGGEWLVATATDAAANPNTSEFSDPTAVFVGPTTFVVNSADDTDDGRCDASHCSLREAILAANANQPAADTIDFAIGSGAVTISPLTPLPAITDATTLAGNSQPGYAGSPLVEIDGQFTGGSGLTLASGAAGSVVRALAVNRFSNIGLRVQADGALVESSYFGVGLDGISDRGNGTGLSLEAGTGTQVGTVGAGNVISGNGTGIQVSGATGAMLQANRIGTNASGTAALANSNNGVELYLPATVGGAAAGQGNLIAGNGGSGVYVGAAATVTGNRIGTDAAGAAAIPNGGHGVFVAASGATIGGATSAAGNLIAGNAGDGVQLQGASTSEVRFNLIGVDTSGMAALANGGVGVQVIGTTGATITDNTIGRNLRGVRLTGGTTGVVLERNLIGTNALGTAALGNLGAGVELLDVAGNLVGTTGNGNLIAGNTGSGVRIVGGAAMNNVVAGNRIGTDTTGTSALANGFDGIELADAPLNTIGGTTAGAGNLIAGNTLRGVLVSGVGATANLIVGNQIGTNAAGTGPIGNGVSGVQIDNASTNTVGGTTVGARNLIAGNQGVGVAISGSSAVANLVQGNYIGTTASGLAALGNGSHGVSLGAAANTIGGNGAGAGNVIAGNDLAGVAIESTGAVSNLVAGNLIGVGADGTTPLGNGSHGVVITASATNNAIGGTAGNTIAWNGEAGVAVLSGVRNAIRNNRIHHNFDLGVDLGGDGVTANDPGDGDGGPNRRQNYPTITVAESDGVTVTITGQLDSVAASSFTLDFYAVDTCDGSGFGEAPLLLGSLPVMTDGSGVATFAPSFPSPTVAAVTAIATDADGNSSEISGCVETILFEDGFESGDTSAWSTAVP